MGDGRTAPWARALLVFLGFAILGCGRVGYEGRAVDAGAGGPTPGVDGGRLPEDGGRPTDAAAPDDAGARSDAAPVDPSLEDAGAPADPCAPPSDSLVARYTFEPDQPNGVLHDGIGGVHGTFEGGTLGTTDGPEGCGRALATADTAGTYAVLPDDPAWDLDAGALDFWVRFERPASDGFVGILSRDAIGTAQPGHLTLYRANDGAIVARIQGGPGTIAVCSAPVPENRWIHVGLNFGAPRVDLYVDGTRATRTDSVTLESDDFGPGQYDCGGEAAIDIAGNDNPWVLGGNGARTNEGELTPIYEPLLGGAIDHLRIHGTRQSF